MAPLFDLSELLTPRELSHKLKVSERTIYREQAEGHLPGRLVRGKLRFHWPEVVKALPRAPVRQPMNRTGITRGSLDLVAALKARAKYWGARR